MTVLRVRILEGLPHPGASCPWAMADDSGAILARGEDILEQLPHARRVELVAPAARVLLTRVEMPIRSHGRLRQMLPFALEDRLSVEPDAVHAALGPRSSDKSYAAAVMDRAWLTQWLGAFSAAGHAPQSVQVETCRVPLERDAWTVVWRGRDNFVRTGIAAGMAIDAGNGSAPPAALALAIAEARVAGGAPQRLLVCADARSTPDLDAWSDALATPSEPAAPFDWSQAPDTRPFELLQGEFAPAGALRALVPALRPTLVLAGLIVALHTVATVAHWVVLDREKSILQAEMKTIFTSTFPTAEAIVDPPLQMRRQLDSLRRASGRSQPDDFMPLLAQVATDLRGGAGGAKLRSVSYEQGRLRVDVELPSRAQAEALLASLQRKRLAVVLEAVNPHGQSVEARFVVSAKRGA